ncbi:MAG: hypothetical protein B6D46_05880 [Polyangiaceae bacterium UTPRO1]|jgi:LemA protein|nr:LemA family protein [Myxococcales bacterium]OQY67552.1 MAG: hypothetical protein B6D46_05880 [Polyangiaceae bacterium UTPRO1]
MPGWIVGTVGLSVVVATVALFNVLVRARNLVRAGWADIDVQLQRRHDLIPQLVTAVKAYADHERTTLEAVTRSRALAHAGGSISERGRREDELAAGVARLLALRERYPDLEASGNFLQLQHDLVEIEERLQQARRFYNGAVRDYNTRIGHFPALLIAAPLGFAPAEFFQAEARGVVQP